MVRTTTVHAVDEWRPVSEYDSLYSDISECTSCGTRLIWGVIRYTNGYEEWALMCPDCGYQSGYVISGEKIVTNKYSRKYPDEWWHIQHEVRSTARLGLSDGHIDAIVQIWRDQGLRFYWEHGQRDKTFKWYLKGDEFDSIGLYCPDIRKKDIGWIKRKVDKVLRPLGMEVVSHGTWVDSGIVGDGGTFTSSTHWSESWRRLFIVVGDIE